MPVRSIHYSFYAWLYLYMCILRVEVIYIWGNKNVHTIQWLNKKQSVLLRFWIFNEIQCSMGARLPSYLSLPHCAPLHIRTSGDEPSSCCLGIISSLTCASFFNHTQGQLCSYHSLYTASKPASILTTDWLLDWGKLSKVYTSPTNKQLYPNLCPVLCVLCPVSLNADSSSVKILYILPRRADTLRLAEERLSSWPVDQSVGKLPAVSTWNPV